MALSDDYSRLVFWLVMTIVALTLSAFYAALGLWGGRLGIGNSRLLLIRRSSWGLFAWAALCLAHYGLKH